jgi:TRAP-type mannitol/chloroaromatic compound transport system substrate-binding protein
MKKTQKGRESAPKKQALSRRGVLRGAAVGAGAVAATALGAPYIRTAKAQTTTWRMQSSWASGVLGYAIFKEWADSVIERTGGELAIQPLSDKEFAGTFELLDAVQSGAIESSNWFSLYGAGRLPATVFMSSYPLGPRYPHEWDTFYYGLGGLEIVRELYASQGLYYVGPIQHGPNIIHSKSPIRSIEDFRGRKMRVPGGMVAELFTAAGAETTLLPGSEIFAALEKGTIDVADYVGPAINMQFGLHQVTNYVAMGPPGYMSIYQPVDLMDFTVNLDVWNSASPEIQQFMESEVHVYSDHHHAQIQKADQAAWPEIYAAGSEVTRLSEDDVDAFTRLAVPLWFDWANKDKTAARLFKIQLDYMMSGSLGYVTQEMVVGRTLDL